MTTNGSSPQQRPAQTQSRFSSRCCVQENSPCSSHALISFSYRYHGARDRLSESRTVQRLHKLQRREASSRRLAAVVAGCYWCWLGATNEAITCKRERGRGCETTKGMYVQPRSVHIIRPSIVTTQPNSNLLNHHLEP